MSENKTVVIEIGGGLLMDVHNLPEGWDYLLCDYDNLESGEEKGPDGKKIDPDIDVVEFAALYGVKVEKKSPVNVSGAAAGSSENSPAPAP